MVVTLLLAVALAVGHHIFYQSHQGREPPSQVYNVWGIYGGLSGQQVILASGAAFAFLVKALLGIAVTTAQEQVAWRSIKTRPTRLASIDGLFRSSDNVFLMFNYRLWGISPLSMLSAAIYW